jgi:hypothetical protein
LAGNSQFPVPYFLFSTTYSGVKPPPKASAAPAQPLPARLFPALFGGFLGISLLKFGNPPIMEKWVAPPSDIYEFVISTPWPASWAYWLMVPLVVVGVLASRTERGWARPLESFRKSKWFLALPLLWLAWQCLSAADSVDTQLSKATLLHFTSCVVCFYLGFFALSRATQPWSFWIPLLACFAVVLAIGWDQHFGGLDASRKYFNTYLYDQAAHLPPEFIKKIQSNRIFSTLFYPNALAGVLLLLLPAMLVAARQWPDTLASKQVRLVAFFAVMLGGLCFFSFGSKGAALLMFLIGVSLLLPAWRILLGALLAIGGLACLYWSGSKGGWLLMLLLGLAALLRLNLGLKVKMILVAAVLLAGLAGFFWKYAAFFEKGATSVSARFDYWRAAVQTTTKHPILGTGPGTFAIPYAEVKRPDAEMSRMVHNDYLEQASDSGLVGFLAYTLFVAGGLVRSYPKTVADPGAVHKGSAASDWLAFAVWLGVLGWAFQSLFEFSLYIPALSWPAFTFLGWLLTTKD